MAVMGGAQAAQTLLQIEVGAREKQGETVTEERKAEFLSELGAKYDRQTEVTYAASRLWVDEIIDPVSTRARISAALDAADHGPDLPRFNTGVLQV
jgi:acetyl-CoA carboxylase carboxyltransferase component